MVAMYAVIISSKRIVCGRYYILMKFTSIHIDEVHKLKIKENTKQTKANLKRDSRI
jgi:hypothetical protein